MYDIFYVLLFWRLPYSFWQNVTSKLEVLKQSDKLVGPIGMNLHPVDMYWSYYPGFSRIPRPQGCDFLVGKIPKGLLFEVLIMRLKLRTWEHIMQETQPCDWSRFDMLQCFFCEEWLTEWAKQVDQMLLIAHRLENRNGIFHVSYQRMGSPFGMIEWSSFNSTFLMLKFGNRKPCRDYHHYHYPNYCNLDLRLKDPTGKKAWRCQGMGVS